MFHMVGDQKRCSDPNGVAHLGDDGNLVGFGNLGNDVGT